MKKDIINSFGNVARIYEETSYLFKDFSAIISGKNFKNITGNSIGTTSVSKALDASGYWLTRYAALFFKPIDQEANDPLLSVTVGFYNDELEAVEPYLALGVVKGMDHVRKSWQYWWLYSPFINEGNNFEYFSETSGDEQKTNAPSMNEEIIRFKCTFDDSSYTWPKEGWFFAVPLLDVRDAKDVERLSRKIIELWTAKVVG